MDEKELIKEEKEIDEVIELIKKAKENNPEIIQKIKWFLKGLEFAERG